MVPAIAVPAMIGSWLIVASTPLNASVSAAGMPEAVRWTIVSKPVPCAAPAMTSSAVACQGHPPPRVSHASRPVTAANTANAACGSRGCHRDGTLVQVTDAVANPAAYPAKVSPERSGLSCRASWRYTAVVNSSPP